MDDVTVVQRNLERLLRVWRSSRDAALPGGMCEELSKFIAAWVVEMVESDGTPKVDGRTLDLRGVTASSFVEREP